VGWFLAGVFFAIVGFLPGVSVGFGLVLASSNARLVSS
jgi:hypothetical protein